MEGATLHLSTSGKRAKWFVYLVIIIAMFGIAGITIAIISATASTISVLGMHILIENQNDVLPLYVGGSIVLLLFIPFSRRISECGYWGTYALPKQVCTKDWSAIAGTTSLGVGHGIFWLCAIGVMMNIIPYTESVVMIWGVSVFGGSLIAFLLIARA